MKFLFTTLLIMSYIAIGTFGISGMHTQANMVAQEHDMSSRNCIGAVVQGVDCPKQANPIEFATFHIDVFKGFSQMILSKNLIAVLFTLFALFFIGLAFFLTNFFKLSQLAFYRCHRRDSFLSPLQQKLLRWLALHEKSPD